MNKSSEETTGRATLFKCRLREAGLHHPRIIATERAVAIRSQRLVDRVPATLAEKGETGEGLG